MLPGFAGIDVWDTEHWVPPVLQGAQPLVHENRFFILDKDGNKIRVYDIDQGWASPRFLWETPGQGQGPGEMDSRIVNNVTVNEENGHLWLSHGHGLIVFDTTGKVVHERKFRYSRYGFLPIGDRLYATPRKLFEGYETALYIYNRTSFLANPKCAPLTQIEALHDLAVTPGGAYITPQPNLYRIDSHIYLLNSAIGELIKMNDRGEIEEVHQIWNKDREQFARAGYEPYRRRDGMQTLQHRIPNPGLVHDGESMWTVTRYFDAIQNETKARITRFKMGEKAFSMYRIPGVEGSLMLLKKQDQSLFFFHLGNTHQLYRVDIGSLKPFAPVRG